LNQGKRLSKCTEVKRGGMELGGLGRREKMKWKGKVAGGRDSTNPAKKNKIRAPGIVVLRKGPLSENSEKGCEKQGGAFE